MTSSGQSDSAAPRRGRPPTQEPGVEWETVTRWRWDQETEIEIRALSVTEIEIFVTTKNGFGAAKGSRKVLLADVRKALDALERSAREVERL